MPPEEIRSRFLKIANALIGVLLIGVIGYVLIEGWRPFDALYMTVITLATVGYGEIHPLSTGGRVFTIGLIFIGIGVLTWAFSNLTAFFVEGELTRVLRRRRMQKQIDSLKDHFIVCGVGHTGQVIIQELRKTRRPFVVVDKSSEVCERLAQSGVPAIQGDATEDQVLQQAGIERATGLFTALTSDQDNAFVALTARGLNPNLRIVSEQVESNVREKLLRSGASAVVNPNLIGGLRMTSEMVRPAVVGFLDHMLRGDGDVLRFEELAVPEGSPLAGKPVGEIKGAQGNAALVVSVLHADGNYELNPSSERPLKAGETLVVMGTLNQLEDLKRKLGNRRFSPN